MAKKLSHLEARTETWQDRIRACSPYGGTGAVDFLVSIILCSIIVLEGLFELVPHWLIIASNITI